MIHVLDHMRKDPSRYCTLKQNIHSKHHILNTQQNKIPREEKTSRKNITTVHPRHGDYFSNTFRRVKTKSFTQQIYRHKNKISNPPLRWVSTFNITHKKNGNNHHFFRSVSIITFTTQTNFQNTIFPHKPPHNFSQRAFYNNIIFFALPHIFTTSHTTRVRT